MRFRPASTTPARRLLVAVAALCVLGSAPVALSQGGDSIERFQVGRDDPGVPLLDQVKVSPTAYESESPAGATHSFTITVRNRRREKTSFQLVPSAVVAADTPGGGVRFLQPTQDDDAASARTWLHPARASFQLQPREYAQVPIEVRVPADARPGGHYAAVMVRQGARDVAADDGSLLGVQSEVAVGVLLTVQGDFERSMRIDRVRAPKLVVGREDWRLDLRVRNTGDVHVLPVGRVRVRSLLLGRTVAQFAINGRRTLPEGISDARTTWTGVPWFGLYKVDVRMQPHGQRSPVVQHERWLVALPPWWVLFIIVMAPIVYLVWRSWARNDRGDGLDPWDTFDHTP